MNVAVIGAGAWGTALAKILWENGHQIRIWGHDAVHLETMRSTRENQRYLAGVPLPPEWQYETNLAQCIQDVEGAILAVPSKAFRELATQMAEFTHPIVSVTKGIEFQTGLTMSGVLEEVVPHAPIAALSGPSLALEVARGVPTAIVASSTDLALAAKVQTWFHRPTFRVYTTTDLIGVELGGSLKNVIAIAAGVSDGLGYGDNAKAALITRAIVEISRLGAACGARAETFAGLSGLGDLAVTCFSKLSRNRNFGEKLGRGESLHHLLSSTVSVVEGYPTARSAWRLAQSHGVPVPIIQEIHSMLYEEKNVGHAVRDLLMRDTKPEK